MSFNKDQKGNAWLKENVSRYKPSIIALAVMVALSTVCSVGYAYLSSFLIDSATDKLTGRLILFASIVLGLLLGRIVLRAITNYYSEKCRATIATDLRKQTFSKILKSNYANVKDYHSGELVARISADSGEIASTTVGIVPQTVGMIIQIVGALVALVFIDPLFTLFLVVGAVVIIGISAILRKKTKWFHNEIMSADAQAKSFMQESIVSELTIKAFVAEDKVAKKADEILDAYKDRRLGRAKLNSWVGVLYALITNVGLVFAIIWCAVNIMFVGAEYYGAVLSIVLLMEQLQRPLSTISAIMPAYYARQASAERLCEIDSFDKENTKDFINKDFYSQIKKISVKDAVFNYDKENVFNGFNADIEMGKTTCIYGESGGGKSTLFKLLLGVYSLDSGSVNFVTDNGEIAIDSNYRKLFAFVPQGNFLFTGTIYENLTFFAEEQDETILKDRVKRAIEDSCSEFVYDLPNGLDTLLTEQGGGLSEGQRQRLAVARAFVSDRPILLLDEATSALDEPTEKRLIENLRAMKDKTCIIISHRQAVIGSASDEIKI